MEIHITFLTLGALFLAGLLADQIGRHSWVPRVTLLLLCGIAVGASGLDVLPDAAQSWYEFLATSALTMVAFLLGGSLTRANLRDNGRTILFVSIAIVLATVVCVSAGLWLIGTDPRLALLLGAIATATAPAATQDVIRQSGIKGPFADTLNGVVAIDDIWALIVFSVVLVIAGDLGGQGDGGLIWHAGQEVLVSILLGLAIGFPAAFLTGRLQPGEPIEAEALGLVFLSAGLAIWLGASFLLTGMTAGAVIVNAARHHTRAFHEIEHIEWPFMILFFILAGASLEVDRLAEVGLIGALYVVLRVAARIAGGWLGATLGGLARPQRAWVGVALLPQAGVAVGMALIAGNAFPDLQDLILTVTIGTTVAFELVGPVLTLTALRAATGQAGKKPGPPESGR